MKTRAVCLFWVTLLITGILVSFPCQTYGQDSSTTSIVLKPGELEFPYLEYEKGSTLVAVEVHFVNVQDLAQFEFTLLFDSAVLEYFTYSSGEATKGGTPWNLSGSGGSSSTVTTFTRHSELRDPWVSGTGHVYDIWFKPKAVGTAQVRVVGSEFRDSQGDLIQHVIEGDVTIKVVLLDAWADGEYAELTSANDALEAANSTLQTAYSSLNSENDELQATQHKLMEDYSEVTEKFSLTEENYKLLENAKDTVDAEFEALQSIHEALVLDYGGLTEEKRAFESMLESLNARLGRNTYITYGIGGAVALLSVWMLGSTIIRRRRQAIK